jgi:hypothetical protein
MFTIRITDEFFTTWEMTALTVAETTELIDNWLSHKDETPIYEILITIDELIMENVNV